MFAAIRVALLGSMSSTPTLPLWSSQDRRPWMATGPRIVMSSRGVQREQVPLRAAHRAAAQADTLSRHRRRELDGVAPRRGIRRVDRGLQRPGRAAAVAARDGVRLRGRGGWEGPAARRGRPRRPGGDAPRRAPDGSDDGGARPRYMSYRLPDAPVPTVGTTRRRPSPRPPRSAGTAPAPSAAAAAPARRPRRAEREQRRPAGTRRC